MSRCWPARSRPWRSSRPLASRSSSARATRRRARSVASRPRSPRCATASAICDGYSPATRSISTARPAGLPATMAEAHRQARPTVVHQGIMRVHARWLEHTKLSIPRFDIPRSVYEIYPDLSHAQDWEQAIAATAFVPDDVIAELCDALGLIGTPEHCARRIADLTAAGVKSLYIMPLQTFVGPEPEIRAFRDAVFPKLK